MVGGSLRRGYGWLPRGSGILCCGAGGTAGLGAETQRDMPGHGDHVALPRLPPASISYQSHGGSPGPGGPARSRGKSHKCGSERHRLWQSPPGADSFRAVNPPSEGKGNDVECFLPLRPASMPGRTNFIQEPLSCDGHIAVTFPCLMLSPEKTLC